MLDPILDASPITFDWPLVPSHNVVLLRLSGRHLSFRGRPLGGFEAMLVEWLTSPWPMIKTRTRLPPMRAAKACYALRRWRTPFLQAFILGLEAQPTP